MGKGLRWRGPVLADDRGTIRHLQETVTAGGGVRVGEGAVCAIAPGWIECATSGSSGAPKRIRRTVVSWTTSFALNAKIFGLDARSVVALPGTMAQSLTLYAALEAQWNGAALVDLSVHRGDRQLAHMARWGTTHVYATPAQVEVMLKGQGGCPSLRYWIIGGGRLSADLRARLALRVPQARIMQFYGASETSFITLDRGDAPEGSVGRAYPQVEIAVDAAGELRVKSPYLFTEYALGSSPDTCWHADGFLSIGEIGHVDAQGFVYIRGRKGRIVQVLDHLVSPEPAEARLADWLGCDVAVVAQPDPLRGARLWAMVGEGPAPEAVEAALVRLRQELGAVASAHGWQRVAPFPLLPTGKPDIRALEARL
ncbi:AMP-binding protein (plasmid) [Thioclava litoralis]|uniref:AMP-binding protein n=1 Tax=Thioclava litoralis TaxID=3076557 RepID=A0ABZ1E361_9RHOB|nr:AMP-binding protein [Thioclava sp. FTW29]